MQAYDPKKIEGKWQKKWQEKKAAEKLSRAQDTSKKEKYYTLVEFPFPSGDGLHVGHVRSYVALDILSRKRRMEGYNVLYPIGWDAFGLPTENYALKTGIHPAKVTKQNTDNFRKQLKALGLSFDWSREINTTDPEYYKWTQWIFLKLYEKGLAYKTKTEISWCPSCKIGLANEEVIDGKCERCGTAVEKREKEQWMLAITKYADRLLSDLDTVDYLEKIKIQQRNWIGKSEGAEIDFKLSGISGQEDGKHSVKVFTTRPDTIFGATFLAISPELAQEWLNVGWEANGDVKKYVVSELKERKARDFQEKEKTGVNTEITAINPANGEKIPVWVVNYVLGGVGTGAIMAVPAHDERDFEFAKKFELEIKFVITPVVSGDGGTTLKILHDIWDKKEFFRGVQDMPGILTASGKFSGMDSEEAKRKITDFVGGKWTATYKLRDWVFSRQRYWGEPIPMIFCEKCYWVPVPEKDLPVKLPNVKNYQPTDTGESPLASISKWVNVKCPKCKSPAKRETDVMPNWAGSSWYFLRYIDPKNKKALADPEKLKHWMGVDWYNGGMEHTTLHLLYSRFWNKFLFDIGVVPVSEPYKKRTSHGLILAEGGVKMSKSKGNVVNPNAIVAEYGADTLRVYEMFMGPFDQAIAWDEKSIIGSRRFLERVWKLTLKIEDKKRKAPESKNLERTLHQTIKKISEDIENMRYNTAISTMMVFLNEAEKEEILSQEIYETFLILLAPFAPHMTEELWSVLGNKKSVHLEAWPKWDESKLISTTMTIALQVNGKLRGTLEVPAGTNEGEVRSLALENESVQKWLESKEPQKVIYIPGKLVSIVV